MRGLELAAGGSLAVQRKLWYIVAYVIQGTCALQARASRPSITCQHELHAACTCWQVAVPGCAASLIRGAGRGRPRTMVIASLVKATVASAPAAKRLSQPASRASRAFNLWG